MPLQRLLTSIILTCLLLSGLLLPLLFTSVNEELFEFIKMLAVYVLAIVSTASYLMLRVAQKRWRWQRTPLDLFLLFFLLAQILATVFSIHPATSFFGYYTRFHGGLLSFLAYASLFYVMVNTLLDQPYHRAIRTTGLWLGSVFLGAVLVSLYAIPEHFGVSPSCIIVQGSFNVSCWVQDVQNRVFATIGQPNWLAAYVLMIIPVAMVGILATLSRSNKTASKLPTWLVKIFWLIFISMLYATLIFTKSRSGWLGLTVAVLIIVSGWLVAHWKIKLAGGKILFLSLATMLLFSGIYGTPFSPPLLSRSAQTSAVTAPQTGTSLESGGTESGEIRKIVWQGALRVWQRYPFLGSGMETFAYSYYQDRPMAHNAVSEWNFLYNKAHNEFLNYLATSGLVGLISYVLLMIIGCWLGIQLFWQRLKPSYVQAIDAAFTKSIKTSLFQSLVASPLFPLALTAAIVGVSVSNFFGFSTVMVSVLMYSYLAIVSVLTIMEKSINYSPTLDEESLSHLSKKQQKQLKRQSSQLAVSPNSFSAFDQLKAQPPTQLSTWWQYALISLISIVALVLLWNTVNWWLADKAYARGKQLIQSEQWQLGLDNLIQAADRLPSEATYKDTLSEQYAKLSVNLVEVNEATLSAEFAQAALQLSDETLKLNPVHLNFHKTRVRVLSQLGVLDQTKLSLAKEALTTAQKLAPTDPSLVFNQGKIAVFEENYNAAEGYFLETITMKPDLVEARMALAQLYELLGRPSEASEQYQYLLTNINPDDTQLQQKVAELATQSGLINQQ